MSLKETVGGLLGHFAKPSIHPIVKSDAILSPDAWKLEQYLFQNIFIYNGMMTGCEEHAFIKEYSLKRGWGFTHADDFILFLHDQGVRMEIVALKIPDEARTGRGSFFGQPGQILGQIFTVPSLLIINYLDKRLLNTVQFQRRRIRIDVPYSHSTVSAGTGKFIKDRSKRNARQLASRSVSEERIHPIWAWTYIARKEYWDNQLLMPNNPLFRPVRMYHPNNSAAWENSYYFYSEKIESQNPPRVKVKKKIFHNGFPNYKLWSEYQEFVSEQYPSHSLQGAEPITTLTHTYSKDTTGEMLRVKDVA